MTSQYSLDKSGRGSKQALRVLACPAFDNADRNPYNALIFRGLEELGVEVVDDTEGHLLYGHYDIVHIHWPEYFFHFNAPSPIQFAMGAMRRCLTLSLARLRGAKVVWTVHNLEPHEHGAGNLQRWILHWFARHVHGVISLSDGALHSIYDRLPELREIPVFIVPHCHYRDAYRITETRTELRARFAIRESDFLFVHTGRIRTNKNTERLLSSFHRLTDSQAALLVAGECSDPELLNTALEYSESDARITTDLNEQSPAAMANILGASDVFVLSSDSLLNSGSVFLSLSMNCPAIVPNSPTFRELRQKVGAEWIFLYDAELNERVLAEAQSWARSTSRPPIAPLDSFAPDRIANLTLDAYSQLVGNS